MSEKASRTGLRKAYEGPLLAVTVGVAIVWMLFQAVIAAQFVFVAPQLVRIVHLGFGMLMVFLITPITRKGAPDRLSAVDIGLCLAVIANFVCVFQRYGVLIRMGGRYETIDIALGVITLVLLYEAARRVISPGLIVLSLAALFYVFLGQYLPIGLGHTGFGFNRVIRHLMLGAEGVYGFALGVSAEIIVIFVIFGAILQEVGIADYFYDLSNAIAGKQRGGPAKVAVISSSLMGMVSGETSANVATTGAFTIPLMKRVGYDKNFAGAVECAASAGGQILPPVMGATAFMLADTLGIPYIQLAIAAALPAILYYTSVFAIVHFRAVRLDLRSSDDVHADWKDLAKRAYLLLPLVAIVVLLVNNFTPTFAAFWGGIGTALVVSFFRKETRITLKKLRNIAYTAAKTAMSLAVATAVVGIIVGTFSLTGISMMVARLIFQFTGGVKLLTLFMTMLVAMVLGMGLPTSAAYVLASISAAPALTMVGIDLLPAHLFVFYFGCMSTITPPVATGAYTAAGLSGGNPNRTGFLSMRLAMAGFIVPFVFLYMPDLLIGSDVNVLMSVFAFLVTFVGLIFMSAAFEGAFLTALGRTKRIIFLLVGIALVLPEVLISSVGLALAAVVFVVELLQRRKAGPKTASAEQTI